jgi:hypothetical protein
MRAVGDGERADTGIGCHLQVVGGIMKMGRHRILFNRSWKKMMLTSLIEVQRVGDSTGYSFD